MDKKIDFLAVGDITAEPFIKIDNSNINCDSNNENCSICFGFGDKVPYESAEITYAVGNSPNVAVGVSRLGVTSSLVSYIGDDDIGKKDIESLMRDNVNVEYLKIVPDMNSNYHYVLWYGNERTILVKHTEFPYLFSNDVPEAKWMYLSSLASNSISYHNQISEYLNKYPDTKLAFQPGTFQIKLGLEALKDIYARTDILFCNYSEAQRILDTKETDKFKLLSMLGKLGPKNVIMTDGIKGAYAQHNNDVYFIPIYNNGMESIESTGAGDAFASGVISALILDKNISEALYWGPINALFVTQAVGAQKGLLTREVLEEYLLNAPDDYIISKLN